MLKIRPAKQRGITKLDWLTSSHTFSFGDYYDPAQMGFHTLRVINQDIVQPGGGFSTHSHKDMEIITYVLTGTLAHKDSLGNETIIRSGEIQRMSAGSGVTHSEYNYSKTELVEFLQIWIVPAQKNLLPSYQQTTFNKEQTGLQTLISSAGENGVLLIHQKVKVLRSHLLKQQTLDISIITNQRYWIQMISGQLLLNTQLLNAGDGAAIESEALLKLKANEASQFLLFELE